MLFNHCEVYIEFDNQNRKYRPNDKITGHVIVEVLKETNCRNLTIEHGWQTHGKGDIDKQIIDKLVAFSGQWQIGKYHYPFSFTAQNSPFTYHGKIISMDWYIFVNLDLALVKGVNIKTDYLLLADYRNKPMITKMTPLVLNEKNYIPMMLWIILGIIIFLVSITILMIMGLMTTDEGSKNIDGMIIAFIIIGVAIWATIYSYRQFMLGLIKVDIIEQSLPKSYLQVILTLCPRKTLMIQYIKVYLVLEEKAVSTGSSSDTTIRKEFVISEQYLPMNQKLSANKKRTLPTINIDLPEVLIPSFESKYNSIKYLLKYDVKMNKQESTFETDINVR